MSLSHSLSDLPQIKELLASSDEEEEVKPTKVEKSYVPKITGKTHKERFQETRYSERQTEALCPPQVV